MVLANISAKESTNKEVKKYTHGAGLAQRNPCRQSRWHSPTKHTSYMVKTNTSCRMG